GAKRRCYHHLGRVPASWKNTEAHIVKRDFTFAFSSPIRWSYAQPGRVVTGAGPNICLHPTLPRTFTHREIARILGFPDDWLIEPLKDTPGLRSEERRVGKERISGWLYNRYVSLEVVSYIDQKCLLY